jgi:hypothetical protein
MESSSQGNEARMRSKTVPLDEIASLPTYNKQSKNDAMKITPIMTAAKRMNYL